jgi:hypothetical protein
MSDEKAKNPNAVALGRLGAKARQAKLTPEQRREIAVNAIRARWAKSDKKKKKKKIHKPT